jgi:hypothetical protein
MPTLQDNGERIKRVREVKATLRTQRDRLLVGLDVARAEHVVHVRHAHTRAVVPHLTLPNTTRGFTQLWARLQQAQRATGRREIGCGPEPPGTYHQAVAAFLEAHGATATRASRRSPSSPRSSSGLWGGLAERRPVRPAVDGWNAAAGPLRAVGRSKDVFPGEEAARSMPRGGPCGGSPGDPGAPLPLSRARTRPGGSRTAARRSDGTTTMGRERSPRSGLWGGRQTDSSRCWQQSASEGGIYLDTAETAGSPIQHVPHTWKPLTSRMTLKPGVQTPCAGRKCGGP